MSDVSPSSRFVPMPLVDPFKGVDGNQHSGASAVSQSIMFGGPAQTGVQTSFCYPAPPVCFPHPPACSAPARPVEKQGFFSKIGGFFKKAFGKVGEVFSGIGNVLSGVGNVLGAIGKVLWGAK